MEHELATVGTSSGIIQHVFDLLRAPDTFQDIVAYLLLIAFASVGYYCALLLQRSLRVRVGTKMDTDDVLSAGKSAAPRSTSVAEDRTSVLQKVRRARGGSIGSRRGAWKQEVLAFMRLLSVVVESGFLLFARSGSSAEVPQVSSQVEAEQVEAMSSKEEDPRASESKHSRSKKRTPPKKQTSQVHQGGASEKSPEQQRPAFKDKLHQVSEKVTAQQEQAKSSLDVDPESSERKPPQSKKQPQAKKQKPQLQQRAALTIEQKVKMAIEQQQPACTEEREQREALAQISTDDSIEFLRDQGTTASGPGAESPLQTIPCKADAEESSGTDDTIEPAFRGTSMQNSADESSETGSALISDPLDNETLSEELNVGQGAPCSDVQGGSRTVVQRHFCWRRTVALWTILKIVQHLTDATQLCLAIFHCQAIEQLSLHILWRKRSCRKTCRMQAAVHCITTRRSN